MTRYGIYDPGDALVGVVEAATPRDALAEYAVAEGFADPRTYPEGEEYFSVAEDGTHTMVVTNYWVTARETDASPDDVERVGEWAPAGRTLMVATFDVTDLSRAERDALAFEVAVQAETSDHVGDDGHGWVGHAGVDEPSITFVDQADVERVIDLLGERQRREMIRQAIADRRPLREIARLAGAVEPEDES